MSSNSFLMKLAGINPKKIVATAIVGILLTAGAGAYLGAKIAQPKPFVADARSAVWGVNTFLLLEGAIKGAKDSLSAARAWDNLTCWSESLNAVVQGIPYTRDTAKARP